MSCEKKVFVLAKMIERSGGGIRRVRGEAPARAASQGIHRAADESGCVLRRAHIDQFRSPPNPKIRPNGFYQVRKRSQVNHGGCPKPEAFSGPGSDRIGIILR